MNTNKRHLKLIFELLLLLNLFTLVEVVHAKSKGLSPTNSLVTAPSKIASQNQILPDTVITLLKKYNISPKNISVYIRELTTKKTILSHNATVLRSPASTIKLLTTYAGLKELGPDYSWKTAVYIRGNITQGILQGDLILKGYGDPYLVEENLWKLIKALREKGLKRINGKLIIDNSYFQLFPHDPSAFDDKPLRVYNGPSSALMYNFQATKLTFKPNYKSSSVDITLQPKNPSILLNNQMILSNGKCKYSHYSPSITLKNNKLLIRGNYAKKCGIKQITRTFSKPERHMFNAFRDFWIDSKGTLKGTLKIGRTRSTDKLFHTYISPPFGEQIRLINKWSNNVMTKQLLLTIGANKFGAPATMDKGIKAILQILSKNKIPNRGITIDNGSGLSRTSKISAQQMGKLLEVAYYDTFMPEFMSSLPLSGLDGTLKKRFKKESFRGKSRFKTGTIDFVTAISGYMLNRQGKRLVIVILHNGKKVNRGRGKKIQNALLRWSFEQ